MIVNGGRLAPVDERLQELRRNLDGLLLKYTEDHPDVKAARQAISAAPGRGARASAGGAGKLAAEHTRDRSPTASMTRSRSGWSTPKLRSPPCSAASPRPDRTGKIEKIAKSAPGVVVQAQDLDRDYLDPQEKLQELVAGAKPLRSPTPPIPRPRRSSSVSSIRRRCRFFRPRRTGRCTYPSCSLFGLGRACRSRWR